MTLARRIEKLTPEQEADLVRFHAEYLAAGRSCEPADRPRAEAAFARAYRTIGREPVPVIWAASPLAAQYLINSLQKSLKKSLGESLRQSPGASLWESLGESLWASLRQSLEVPLGESLGESLGALSLIHI